jgi:hypothetical protein
MQVFSNTGTGQRPNVEIRGLTRNGRRNVSPWLPGVLKADGMEYSRIGVVLHDDMKLISDNSTIKTMNRELRGRPWDSSENITPRLPRAGKTDGMKCPATVEIHYNNMQVLANTSTRNVDGFEIRRGTRYRSGDVSPRLP